MNYSQLNKLWEYRCHSTAKFVLMALAKFSDEYGKCFPSIETLSMMTCLEPRSIYRSIETLAKAGAITVKAGGGRGYSNHYEINPDLYSGFNDRNPDLKSPIRAKETLTNSHKTVTISHKNPDLKSFQLYRELPRKGKAPQFGSVVQMKIEAARNKRASLKKQFCLGHSLDGDRWLDQAAKAEFDRQGKLLAQYDLEMEQAI